MFLKAKKWYNDYVVTPIPITEGGENWLEVHSRSFSGCCGAGNSILSVQMVRQPYERQLA